MMVSPPIEMGSLGMADSLILMVLALVVFGPRRLPQIGRQIGKLMYEFRKASNDFKFQMEEELRASEEADRRKKEEEAQRQRALAVPAQESVSADPRIVNAAPAEGSQRVKEATQQTAASEEAASKETKQEAATEAAAENGLRVAPPSTGETVAGTPPWRRKQAAPAEGGPSADEPAPREKTEAVSQNG